MTILTLFTRIIRNSRIDQILNLPEIENISRRIASIRSWVTHLESYLNIHGLSDYGLSMHRNFIFRNFVYINEVHVRISQQIERLRYISLANQFEPTPENFPVPTLLNDEESLSSCPVLKDKLASSTATLLDAAPDDICTVCLNAKISAKENFAILDKCVHLFCQVCIEKWFENA